MNFTEYTTKRKEAAKSSNVIKTGRIDSEMMHVVLSKLGRCVGGADGMALCGDDYFWLVVPVEKTAEIIALGFVHPNRSAITKPAVTGKDGKKVQFMIERNYDNLKVCHDILLRESFKKISELNDGEKFTVFESDVKEVQMKITLPNLNAVTVETAQFRNWTDGTLVEVQK